MAFVAGTDTLAKARPLLAESWSPKAVALGTHVACLWCARGFTESALLPALGRLTGGANNTTRTWATVPKLQSAAGVRTPSRRERPPGGS